MELIDNEGKLLGIVNVIDALAILLIITVLIAGGILFGFISGPTVEETRYVTIDLGDQPEYIATQIETGDVMAPEGTDGNLTVTDVYLTPTINETVSVLIRAEIEGELVDSEQRVGTVFEYDETVVRPGAALTVNALDYELTGTVVSVAPEGTQLDTSETTVTLRTEIPAMTARQLRAGDVYTIAGGSVASIETVTIYPTTETDTRLAILEVRLQTIEHDGTAKFGTESMRIGRSIPFETNSYDFTGTIITRGSLSEVSEAKTVTATIKLERVHPEQADILDAGMTERIDGKVNARVTEKHVEPAVTILTSDDGDIYQREHPRNKDVYLKVELSVLDTGDSLYFHGERLQHGGDVVLDFRTVTVNGILVDIEE